MGVFPFQGKTHMVEPGIEPGTSWLVVRSSDHQVTRLVRIQKVWSVVDWLRRNSHWRTSSNIALPWQDFPAYRFPVVHCHLVLFLPWHVFQALGSISRSDSSRQALKTQVWTTLGRCTLCWSTEHLWAWWLSSHCPKQALQGPRPTFGEVGTRIQTLCVIRLAAMFTNTFVKQTSYVTC
jgi:hypothetical protein